MAFKQGEIYRCPDPNCGCEITVTRGAAPDVEAIKILAAAAARKCRRNDGVKRAGFLLALDFMR